METSESLPRLVLEIVNIFVSNIYRSPVQNIFNLEKRSQKPQRDFVHRLCAAVCICFVNTLLVEKETVAQDIYSGGNLHSRRYGHCSKYANNQRLASPEH